MSTFALASWGAWLTVVLCAAAFRSRLYATFIGVILGIYTLVALPLAPYLHVPAPLLYYVHGAAYLQWLLLAWPRMRSLPFRILVSWPGLYFSAGVLLALPWALVAAFGFHPWAVELPFFLGAIGFAQSLTTRTETHTVEVGRGATLEGTHRLPFKPALAAHRRPLRIVQLSDTHLGPFMSVERLARICQRAVDANPDLILLTGDFLTMESQSDARWLTEALAPLRACPGRVFACFGNHDHEAPRVVRTALESAGIRLLIDDAVELSTPAGQVQLVGFDFSFRDKQMRMERVCTNFPRTPGALRLALLHDPGAFHHLPPGEADLVLSGHTHGGQLGLVSLRSPWTVVSWLTQIPDHGLWGRGHERLYVHRGTGHYGFPLRLGVPAEESILQVDYTGWHAPGSA